MDCLNIDDGSCSQLGHPEEGVWKKFKRGINPVENPESESARAQIDGLAPVEEDVGETQNLGMFIDSPNDNGIEPSGRKEQDQICSAFNSTSSLPMPRPTPRPRRPKSHWKAIIMGTHSVEPSFIIQISKEEKKEKKKKRATPGEAEPLQSSYQG